jgi:hypothetical protein
MNDTSTIRAFQNILAGWKWEEPSDAAEEFAIKRFQKKMEVPDPERAKERAQQCWETYVAFDESLSLPRLLPGNWYKARLLLLQWLGDFKLGPLDFSPGSAATPTRGRNSLESKLQLATWDCTSDCWDLWAETAFEVMAIKRATRARFSKAMLHDGNAIRAFHIESWKRFGHLPNGQFLCFKRQLSVVTVICEASRFSTVPKNNEVDRPIELQPFCNILVQRRVGNGIREVLKSLGYDLDHLADLHRQLVSERVIATIDLKNASDSVQLALCEFLFHKQFVKLLKATRATYLMGPKSDGNDFHVLKKVSSMGNGFTFELMTMILLALGLQRDPEFSVFGDDIICRNEHARGVITDLLAVGFVVNDQKSFIESPFRESCGANYLDGYGYLRSFDFRYPETIHDCVVIANKACLLRETSRQFLGLHDNLIRSVPLAQRGPAGHIDFNLEVDVDERGFDKDVSLSAFFWDPKWVLRRGREAVHEPHLHRGLRHIHQDPETFFKVTGFKWKAEVASEMRNHLQSRRHVGKIHMYLFAGRRTPDVVTGRGCWQPITYITDGISTYRAKAIVDAPSRGKRQ